MGGSGWPGDAARRRDRAQKTNIATWRSLRRDLEDLGLAPGDTVMVHASLRSVGPVASGADAVIRAIVEAVAPGGTLMVYTDWEADIWELEEAPDLSLATHSVRPEIRNDVLPFDPAASRAIRENGALMELVRTTPGARRSGNPGASCAAIGAKAAWLTADHPLDYGYGDGSPFAKLVEAGGKVLMLGATADHMTLLHHAEHLAQIPDKRIYRMEVPLLVDGETQWRWIEEFNTSVPVAAGLEEDYFATLVTDFLASGRGCRGKVGQADCILVDAGEIVPFAVAWIEQRLGA
jgi:aminoglycoside 3-N-acetyltransferase